MKSPIILYNSRWKLLVLLLVFTLFSGVGVLLVFYSQKSTLNLLLGTGNLIIFGLGIFITARELLLRKPRLILNDEGLVDQINYQSPGTIPWTAIKTFERVRRFQYLNVQITVKVILKNPTAFLSRIRDPKQKRLLSATYKRNGTPIVLPLGMLKGQSKDLVALLQKNLTKHRT